MPRSGQRSEARVAARRAGLLDRERIERVVERGRVAEDLDATGLALPGPGEGLPPGYVVDLEYKHHGLGWRSNWNILKKHKLLVAGS
jgi:hypothetical protein